MELNYSQYIEKFLSKSMVMSPLPTSLQPEISIDKSIRAVLFDIYGTILISASGDIDESEISLENLKTALDETGIIVNQEKRRSDEMLAEMLDSFREAIIRIH